MNDADLIDTRDYRRIERAIAWIDAHHRDQPSVADMARAVNLSDAHFSRLFTRWAGISPQRYLASLTLEEARFALSRQASVEMAADYAGLSGAGRLHDLFVRIDAVSPGEFKRLGDGVTFRYGFAESAFGDAMLLESPRGIVSLSLDQVGQRSARLAGCQSAWPNAALRHDAQLSQRIAQLLDPVAHRLQETITVTLAGTPFQHKVWQALLELPMGATCSYSELAGAIGRPGASRAVGSAVGKNAVAVLIPCHRVLRAGGALGGYRWGESHKRLLLAWERCQRLRA